MMEEKGFSGFCEACNGCSFYFIASLIKNMLVKTVFESYNLKLSLLMFLICFLILAKFQPNVSYRHTYIIKNRVYGLRARSIVHFRLLTHAYDPIMIIGNVYMICKKWNRSRVGS